MSRPFSHIRSRSLTSRAAAALLVFLGFVGTAVAGAPAASAVTVLGPVYPPPGGVTFSSSPSSDGEIGKAGVTWSYSGFDPSAFRSMVWGATDVRYAFDGVPDTPDESLIYSAGESQLATGRAVWAGTVGLPLASGASVPTTTRFVLQVTDASGGPLPLTGVNGLPDFAGVVPANTGGLQPVTGSAGFVAHLRFEALNGTNWIGATSFYDDQPTPSGAPGVRSEFGAGFWYVPPVQPTATLSATSLAFDPTDVGQTAAPLSVTITNDGPGSLQLEDPTFGGPNRPDFGFADSLTTCTSSTPLAQGASCTVGVSFLPHGKGPRSGTLSLPSNASNSPLVLALNGIGRQAVVGAAPNPIDFGDVVLGSTAHRSLRLGNTGDAPLDLRTAGTTPNSSPISVRPGTCTDSIPAGGTCTADVTFAPVATGPQQLVLTFGAGGTTGSAANAPYTVVIGGTGVQAGSALTPATLDFGAHGIGLASGAQVLTLSSTGGAPLHVSALGVTGAAPADFTVTGGTCGTAPFTLASGSACTVAVTFTPTAAGSRTAALTVRDDAPGSPRSSVLTGTGVAVADLATALGATPTSPHTNKPLTYTITVRNAGPTSASQVTLLDTLPSKTTYVSRTVPAGGMCTTPPAGSTGTVSCDLGTLAPGVSKTVSLTVSVIGGGGTTISDTATSISPTPDPQAANNSATITTTVFGKK